MAGTTLDQPKPLPPALNGYAEISAAFQIIRRVRKANLKWQPAVFNKVLYEGTELARPGTRENVGENEVLMKNVYYLAKKTRNISNGLVISLFQAAVLTAEEVKAILLQPTSKLKAVKMYAVLVEKEDPDGSITESVISALDAHDNVEVSELLISLSGITRMNQERVEPQQQVLQDEAHHQEIGSDDDEKWTCRFCTFINDAYNNVCDVCAKTDFNPNFNSTELNFCPRCTLVNENGADICDACEFNFRGRTPYNASSDDDN